MSQLSLAMPTRLAYGPHEFVVHAGVAGIVGAASDWCSRNSFSVMFVEGGARSGKTHLSIFLAQKLSELGRYPRIVEGHQVSSWVASRTGKTFSSDEALIIDDADSYFDTIQPGDSGEFVAIVEDLRKAGGLLVLLSSSPIESFPCDEHVISRIRPGVGYQIGQPLDTEVPGLLTVMAKQRGMWLSARKVDFLLRRIGRDLPAIEMYLMNLGYLSQSLGKPIRFSLMNRAI